MMIAFTIFLALLFAQQPEPVSEATGAIRGTIVNGVTGTPLSGATIKLISGNSEDIPPTTTDREGKFEFKSVTARRGSILASLDGYNYPSKANATNRVRQISLAAGQTLDIRIELVPAFAVSGRLLDDNKQPISKVSVQLSQKGYAPDGTPTLAGTSGYALTDERGEYRISNVIPGDYAVYAVRNEVPTYFPGVTIPDWAIPVSVRDNDVAGISFTLIAANRYAIQFRLSGVNPPPKEISVNLPGRVSGGQNIVPYKNISSTADGVYTFENILPGSYRLAIHWYEEQPTGAPVNPVTRATRTTPFDISDRDLDLGTIDVVRPVAIEGRITFKGMDPFRINIILDPGPGEPIRSSRTSDWWIGANNTFSISEVPEGRYIVRTSFLEDRYLASAVYNGVDVLGKEITIDGSGDGTLDIVIDAPTGNVVGVVRNAKGDPVADATIVLFPPADRRDAMDFKSTTQTDNDGKFSFEHVAPGSYSLFAWEYIPQFAYRNAEWIKQYETLATRVTVEKGRTGSVSLRLILQK
jgi:protocatechuate 3,4-dioxygenase beta subunit